MFRQKPVFHRPEERRNGSEPAERDIKKWQRAKPYPRRRDGLYEDFADLQAARDQGLVMRVGQFAGKAREEHRWQDENTDRQRDQRAGILSAEPEQDQRHQKITNEIVVEGRKEPGTRTGPQIAGCGEGKGTQGLSAKVRRGRRAARSPEILRAPYVRAHPRLGEPRRRWRADRRGNGS